MSNKKINVLLGSIVIAFSASANVLANDQMKPVSTENDSSISDKPSASVSDQKMMNKLTQANMAEVALAELAKTKATDKQVLKFADMMIEDHSMAQKDLAEIAKSAGVDLPKETDEAHADLLKKMIKMDHDEFNRTYKSQAVKDHNAAQKLLKKISANTKNADFKALAKKLTPTIDQHMKMAKAMQSAK